VVRPPLSKAGGTRGYKLAPQGVQITAFCRVVLACLSIHKHHMITIAFSGSCAKPILVCLMANAHYKT